MKRKLTIEVKTVKEFEAVQRAIQKPDVMAFLIITGILLPLNSRERSFVIRTANEVLELQKGHS